MVKEESLFAGTFSTGGNPGAAHVVKEANSTFFRFLRFLDRAKLQFPSKLCLMPPLPTAKRERTQEGVGRGGGGVEGKPRLKDLQSSTTILLYFFSIRKEGFQIISGIQRHWALILSEGTLLPVWLYNNFSPYQFFCFFRGGGGHAIQILRYTIYDFRRGTLNSSSRVERLQVFLSLQCPPSPCVVFHLNIIS